MHGTASSAAGTARRPRCCHNGCASFPRYRFRSSNERVIPGRHARRWRRVALVPVSLPGATVVAASVSRPAGHHAVRGGTGAGADPHRARRHSGGADDPLVAGHLDARVRLPPASLRDAATGRDPVRGQPRQLGGYLHPAQPAGDGVRGQARNCRLAAGGLAGDQGPDHLPPARQYRIAGRGAAGNAAAPAKRQAGGGLPGRTYPWGYRSGPVPCAHLPGSGGSRRAGTAGGAAVRVARQRAGGGGLR